MGPGPYPGVHVGAPRPGPGRGPVAQRVKPEKSQGHTRGVAGTVPGCRVPDSGGLAGPGGENWTQCQVFTGEDSTLNRGSGRHNRDIVAQVGCESQLFWHKPCYRHRFGELRYAVAAVDVVCAWILPRSTIGPCRSESAATGPMLGWWGSISAYLCTTGATLCGDFAPFHFLTRSARKMPARIARKLRGNGIGMAGGLRVAR